MTFTPRDKDDSYQLYRRLQRPAPVAVEEYVPPPPLISYVEAIREDLVAEGEADLVRQEADTGNLWEGR